MIGHASAELVGAGIVESVDDVTAIDDCILGTRSSAPRTPWAKRASRFAQFGIGVIETLFFGKTHSDNVGYHHPVTIFSRPKPAWPPCKRMWINDNGLSSYPAASNAETHICIHDIQSCKGRRLIERMAWKRAGKQQSQAECIASQHAEQRLNERIDQQAAEPLDKANKQYVEKSSHPFSDRNLFRSCSASARRMAFGLLGLQAGGGKLAAPARRRRWLKGPT